MSNTVIQVQDLSKQYRLGEIGTGSMVHDLNRWWHGIRGKEDPYLKVGEANDRSKSGESEYVWSLRDLNFSVQQGDAVGIIGSNGAGKSTLLKILSRVTTPTTGSVKIKGRIASLLEVGTGFHPDLSGRDNIFLNGAILGMRKDEIKKKFDEIVDFSGVERYVDTPVKRYSSGMYVRLAFAVAAHLDPDILIVDEVLAVGDAEFQKKCMGKMKDVNVGEGKTVLFVSHNMAAIQQLCERSILLKNGSLSYQGTTTEVASHYLNSNGAATGGQITLVPDPKAELSFRNVKIVNESGTVGATFTNNDAIYIIVDFVAHQSIKYAEISICLKNSIGVNVLFASLSDSYNKQLVDIEPGEHRVKIKIKDNFLFPDTYYIKLIAHQPMLKNLEQHEDLLKFDIIDMDSTMAPYGRGANVVTCVLGGTYWELIS